jgi:hypothetical protein
MRQLSKNYSLATFLDELEFTEAALSADEESADLAPQVASQIAEWPGVYAKEREARRAVTRADAVVAVRNGALDSTTSKFSGVALVEANQDRKSVFFRRFFPVPASEFVRKNLRVQAQQTLEVMVPEIAKLVDSSPLKPFGTRLEKLSRLAIEALDARSKAMGARGMASADVEEWKDGVNRLRSSLHAELLKRAAEKGYPKSWSETFFHADSERSAEPKASDPEPEPVNPAS